MSKEGTFCSSFCHLPALLLLWSVALRSSPDPRNKLSCRPEILPNQNSLDMSSRNGTALLQCWVERKSRAPGTGLMALFQSGFWHQPWIYLERHLLTAVALSFVSVMNCNPWLDLRQGAQAFPPAIQSPWDRSFCSSKLSLAAPFQLHPSCISGMSWYLSTQN